MRGSEPNFELSVSRRSTEAGTRPPSACATSMICGELPLAGPGAPLRTIETPPSAPGGNTFAAAGAAAATGVGVGTTVLTASNGMTATSVLGGATPRQ